MRNLLQFRQTRTHHRCRANRCRHRRRGGRRHRRYRRPRHTRHPRPALQTYIAAGSVIVITGGSRGLGLAIAMRFAKQQVRFVLAARKREELQQAQNFILAAHPHLHADDFYLVDADLSTQAECNRLIAEAITRFGRIDVLVNNAGIIEVGPIEAQTTEAFERAMQVNFFAALYTTWAALPHMRTQTPLTGHRAAPPSST